MLYGGEPFLEVGALPDYEANARSLTVLLATNAALWLVIGFVVCIVRRQQQRRRQDEEKTRSARSKPTKHSKKQQIANKDNSNNNKSNKKTKKKTNLVKSCLFYWTTSSLVILGVASEWNTKIARTVFQMPLLSTQECQEILDIAAKVAWRNYQRALFETSQNNQTSSSNDNQDLLQEPLGWHKTRPEAYQTTDLQPALDPFEPHERDYLRSLLDRRLGPTVARIFGVPVTSIRAQDMFLARYEPTGQVQLRRHVDDTDVSFNLQLSHNFTGG